MKLSCRFGFHNMFDIESQFIKGELFCYCFKCGKGNRFDMVTGAWAEPLEIVYNENQTRMFLSRYPGAATSFLRKVL